MARIWTEAVGVARESGDRGLEALLLNNLGEAELSQGNLEEAEARLGEACSIAEAMNDRRVLFDAIRNLGVLQSRKGNPRLALDHAEATDALAADAELAALYPVGVAVAAETGDGELVDLAVAVIVESVAQLLGQARVDRA